jgi:hypothetical protein
VWEEEWGPMNDEWIGVEGEREREGEGEISSSPLPERPDTVGAS